MNARAWGIRRVDTTSKTNAEQRTHLLLGRTFLSAVANIEGVLSCLPTLSRMEEIEETTEIILMPLAVTC